MSENKTEKIEKKPVRFAPETIDARRRKEDEDGGSTIKVAPINVPVENLRSGKGEYADATLESDAKPRPPVSRFAPKTEPFELPSGMGTVSLRRIALGEDGLFKSLATSMFQYAPAVSAMNMRGVMAMYRATSETIAKVVIACASGSDVEVAKLPLCDKTAMFYKIVELTYGAKHRMPLDDGDDAKPGSERLVEVDLSKLKVVRAGAGDMRARVPLETSFGPGAYAIVRPPTIDDEPVFYTDDEFAQIYCVVESILMPGGSDASSELSEGDRLEAVKALHPNDIRAREAAVERFNGFGIDTNVKARVVGAPRGEKPVEFNVTVEAIMTYVVNGKASI